MAALLRLDGESDFKVRAYETGAARVAQVQGDLRALAQHGKLTEIPGIGAGLAARIAELLSTGRMKALDDLRTRFPPGIIELTRLPNLGVKKAVQLYAELGVEDVASLERACREDRVRRVKGFGATTQAKLLEAIAQLESAPPPSELRRLGDALPQLEQLARELEEGVPKVQRAEPAGDVRRGCEEVSQLELVVSTPRPKAVRAALSNWPTVARVLRRDDERSTVRLFEHDLLVDVRAVNAEAWATTLMHATGSRAHWDRLVARAESAGLTLTPGGLHRGDERIWTPDEVAVYRALGLAPIPPELREDQGELEAAERGELPPLLELSDIRGVVHSHSVWSDGANTIEEMALAAKARGLQYLTVTEHSPTASYAGGVKLAELPRQWDEIDALNERLDGFRILKGVESDILPDGSLDYPDRVLDQLDVVIGSVHARHQMNEDAMTRRILRALENPRLDILGHATGRLLQRRDPYAVRMEELLDTAAKHGVAIEVNGNPRRLDLSAHWARSALRRGIKIVASTDSHSIRELDNLRYAVSTARRGGAGKNDVLNTQDAEGFTASLRRRRAH